MLFSRQNFSLHLLEIRAGGFCSEHKHERKLNHFYVMDGALEVRTWPAGGSDVPDITTVGAGQQMTVPVGVWHQFYSPVSTTCLEIYEAAPVEEDIVRRTTGGN
jgi:mannose-6-phosphate isomerase-like protein (cupin superfamily)